MAGKLRIAIGALLLGAAGAVGFVGWATSAQKRVTPIDGGFAINRAAKSAAEALQGELENLRLRAKAAADLEPLKAALSDRVDIPTVVDLLSTEDWWRGYRDEMAATRLIFGNQVAHQGTLDLGTNDSGAVLTARQDGPAAQIISLGGRPVMVAAARVDINAKGDPTVVLAKPFDVKSLNQVAARTQLSLLLTDGRVPLAMAGDEQMKPFLESLIARTAQVMVQDSDSGREAARVTVSKDVNLWAARQATVSAADSGSRALFLGGAGALAVVGVLLLVLRKRGEAAVGTEYPAEHTLPFGTPQRPRPGAITARSPKAVVRTSLSTAESPVAAHAMPQTMPEPTPAAVIPVVNGDTSKLFGRYKILERLGVGGMSEVYTAVAHGAEGFSRTFVIKRLRPELARNKEAVAQFIDEARVQASLVHSNIVPVFDFGMMGGEYFMIEEYILGRDLARVSTRCVERTGFRLEPRLVYYFAYEALQALAYAHSKRGRDGDPLDIVHRDVSATNVMLSSSGEVKLFDFGIAKANRRNTQTQAGMVKGNANFMSPEQARGQNVDHRSDLFSLALVMYFCLTNQLLYTGDNDLDILYRAACGPTAEDLERIYQLAPPAADILLKALSVDPNDRYQSADEFAAALAPHATGMKLEAASLMELLFGDELRTEAA
jgi:sensor domain CHASE-containing protein